MNFYTSQPLDAQHMPCSTN